MSTQKKLYYSLVTIGDGIILAYQTTVKTLLKPFNAVLDYLSHDHIIAEEKQAKIERDKARLNAILINYQEAEKKRFFGKDPQKAWSGYLGGRGLSNRIYTVGQADEIQKKLTNSYA